MVMSISSFFGYRFLALSNGRCPSSILCRVERQTIRPFATAKHQRGQKENSNARNNNNNIRKTGGKKRKETGKQNRWRSAASSSTFSHQSRGDTRTPLPDQVGAGSSPVLPPALLLPTASPYVFVSKLAAEQAEIDPRKHLFVEFSPASHASHSDSSATTTSSSSWRTIVTQPHTLPVDTVFQRMEPHLHFPDKGNHPTDDLPRVAFLGRSNVGKSSLLNALIKTDLAITSKKPGRTQQVYYYAWQQQQQQQRLAYLVDLPGYGYAVGPDDRVQEWQRRTQQFLMQQQRQQQQRLLSRLYLLQDARVGPQAFDQTVMGWLDEAEIPYTVVLTKVDGVGRKAQVIRHVNQVCMRYHQQQSLLLHNRQDDDDDNDNDWSVWQSPVVHVTSAKTGAGLAELWSSIEADIATVVYDDDDHDE